MKKIYITNILQYQLPKKYLQLSKKSNNIKYELLLRFNSL